MSGVVSVGPPLDRVGPAVRSTLPEGPYTPATPNTHTDRDALAADLAATRARGYSIDREEGVLGIIGFALRYDAPAQDATSCSVPVARLTVPGR